MSAATREVKFTEVQFERGASNAELRLTTEQDNRNEGDGYLSATILLSGEHDYTIGSPGEAVVRVRDDDIPEVTLQVLSPAAATLDGSTWLAEMPEGTKRSCSKPVAPELTPTRTTVTVLRESGSHGNVRGDVLPTG